MTAFIVQASYTVAELARMARYTGPRASRKCRTLLEASGVTIHASGNGRVLTVYLTDLQQYVPSFWASLQTLSRDQEESDYE